MPADKQNFVLVSVLLGAGFLMIFALIFVLMLSFMGVEADFSGGDGIGVLEIKGVIQDSTKPLNDLNAFLHDDRVKAVLVRLDSPGGAVGPSQEIYGELLRVRKTKPVVASFGSVAASGAYYIACGADRIFTSPGTLTGSIGVILESAYMEELMRFLKIEPRMYKAGEHKDMLNPFRRATEKEEELVRDMLNDVHDQFVTAVSESRGIAKENLAELTDGRILTGRQALNAKLVDELGNFRDAVDYLAKAHGLGDDPKLIYPPKETFGYLERLMESAMQGVRDGVRDEARSALQYRWTP